MESRENVVVEYELFLKHHHTYIVPSLPLSLLPSHLSFILPYLIFIDSQLNASVKR